MLYLFPSNGLRFVPVNALLESTETNYRLKSYSIQDKANRVKGCFLQPIDKSDISRVQAWSDTAVTLRVYNKAGTLLSTFVVPNSHTMGDYDIYNQTITWNSIVGLNEGSYIVASNTSGDFWLSEPLDPDPNYNLVKIVYSNRKDHTYYGSYRKCFEQIAYVGAEVWEYDRASRELAYEDSALKDKVLKHDFKFVQKLHTDAIPYYLHDIVEDSLNHDIIIVQGVASQKVIGEKYKRNHQDFFTLHTGEVLLREAETAIRRIVSQRNTNEAQPPEITPETNITNSSFTANWNGEGDSFDVQLSTTPNFSSIVVSANTTNRFYNFTGLTSCQKYYYRVRANSCAGVSAWVNNTIQHQISVHFRGLDTAKVLEFDERIAGLQVFNIFNNANNSSYKFAPLHGVSDWNLYPNLTLSQLQTQISADSDGIYSIRIQITDYVQGSDAGLVLDFTSSTFYLQVGCLRYITNTVSGDFIIFFKDKVKFESVINSAGLGVFYNFIPNLLDDLTTFQYSTLTPLNSDISAHVGDYAIGVWFANRQTTLTFNISYL